jgi:prepilin-type processing-associated H-X9-DG protein
LSTSFFLYIDDYEGYYPHCGNTSTGVALWDMLILPYCSEVRSIDNTAASVFKCPDDRLTRSSIYTAPRSYGINSGRSFSNDRHRGIADASPCSLKASTIPKPTEMLVLGERVPTVSSIIGGNSGQNISASTSASTPTNEQIAFRHDRIGKRTNMYFADGHVAYVNYYTPDIIGTSSAATYAVPLGVFTFNPDD